MTVENAVRGAIDHVVTADAVLYPINQANVTAKISSPVRRMLVNRGDHVRAGQVLVELESGDLAASANESKAQYEQTQAAYQTLTGATVHEDKTKAQTDVQTAQQVLDAAKKLYDNRVALQREGALAQKLVDDAKVAMVQAQSQLETARRHLEALNQVSQRETLRGAEAQVNAAKAHYDNALVQLSYAQIHSPISGVVSDRQVYPGEMPPSGSPIVSIVDISQVVARANVPVKEAVAVKVGRPARITGPDGDLAGKVTVVSPAVDPSTTTVEVWVQAANPGERLKPGGTVRVAIIAETIQNTLVVPATALLNSDEGGQKVMIVTSGNIARERKVSVGVRQGDRVQILSGLQEGDQVVTSGGLGLDDKGKVIVQAPKSEEDEDEDQPDDEPKPDDAKAKDKAKDTKNEPARSPDKPAAGEHWTARFSRPIIFVILTLVAIGTYLAFTIPVAVFPSTDFPRVVVGIDNGVAPINQMQVTVTRPIEEAMNSVPGLEQVRSTTSRGSAEINLFFNWNADMFQTLQYVNAALARVQPSLPATAKLTANRLTFAAFPILGYSLTSDSMSQTQLWELANYTIKPRLNRVNGVSMVVLQGGSVPEFQIEPDPAKLLEAQVTVPGILDAVSKFNMIDSPGLIENNHELAITLVTGQTRDPAEIANIVVRTTPTGVPVRIGDIATVHPSVMPVYTIVTATGKPAVLLNVFRQPEGNTVAVADAAGSELDQIRKTLPPGVKVQTFYDQSMLVRDSIASVRDAILIGLVLAAIILVLFLRDWGSSLVAALVIPATVAITLIALRIMGQSFNLMTLGGLAAAVGLIIDDAIVVVENIVLHRDSGQSRGEAIRSALREIRVPLVFSTITPIVVFLPLISITGVTGTFFRALALTVGTSLFTSLALALTWTPTLSHYLLRRRKSSPRKSRARRTNTLRRPALSWASSRGVTSALCGSCSRIHGHWPLPALH